MKEKPQRKRHSLYCQATGQTDKSNRRECSIIKKEKHQRLTGYRQHIPLEGKFGQGKNRYNLNYIRAKTERTSEAWVRSTFLVLNFPVLVQYFLAYEKTVNFVEILFVFHSLKKSMTIRLLKEPRRKNFAFYSVCFWVSSN